MRKILSVLPSALLMASLAACPLQAQQATTPRTPGEILQAAPANDWVRIAPGDLMVMDLAPDATGKPRRVVIQFVPRPFSQGWIANIRRLAAAHWYDGTAVVRVQDNYVAQWGDPDAETPGRARPLPNGLIAVPESAYTVERTPENEAAWRETLEAVPPAPRKEALPADIRSTRTDSASEGWHVRDSYAPWVEFHRGWPVGADGEGPDARFWPIHCYGSVGVGRNLSPDTGSGAELYAVIGHAPRQLDRNIAVIGRVIEGIEHLSSLPRGTGDIGFYKTAAERTAITSVRMGTEVPDLPAYEYLSTASASFTAYADKRANRKDDFYIRPAGGVDACNVQVPMRAVKP